MARPNVDMVKDIYDALRRKDAHAIAVMSRADIQVQQSAELPWGGAYAGVEQAMAFFGKVMATIDSHVKMMQILDADDHIVVVGRTAGTVKATGKEFDVPFVHVWQLEGNRVARLDVFLDNVAMLPALAQEAAAAR